MYNILQVCNMAGYEIDTIREKFGSISLVATGTLTELPQDAYIAWY